VVRVGYELPPGQSAEWTFVVGRGFMAALPGSTSSGVVATLAKLVRAPRVEAEEIVALLPLGGAQEVERFAVVVQRAPTDEDGIPVSVIVRGEIAVDVFSVGGSRRFTAGGIRPWLLADFRAVIGLVIGSPGQAVLPAEWVESGRPFGVGSVAANTLFWSLGQAEPAEAERAEDATIIRPPRPGTPAESDTVLRSPHQAADTVILARGSGRPAGASRQAEAARAPAALPDQARYGVRLPDGGEVRLDTIVHLGRRPRPPRIQSAVPPRLITVASPTSAVSGTHLEIRQEGGSVVVTDLGSTNGTIVNPPRGRTQRLRAGQSLTVLPGTRMDIGDGNIIEILPVSGT
jgi:hypothetical protein